MSKIFAPAKDSEGSLGTNIKHWSNVYTYNINGIEVPVSTTIEDAGKVLKLNEDGTKFIFADIENENFNDITFSDDHNNDNDINDTNTNDDTNITSDEIQEIYDINNSLKEEIQKLKKIVKSTVKEMDEIKNKKEKELSKIKENVEIQIKNKIWIETKDVVSIEYNNIIVDDNEMNQDIYIPGRPLKIGNTYQIVESYNAGNVILIGGILEIDTIYKVSYSDFTRIKKIDINIPGFFAHKDTKSAIKDFIKHNIYWDMGKAELVGFKHVINANDSNATENQPKINILINGLECLSEDAITNIKRTIEHCNVPISYNDIIELKTVKASGGDDILDNALDLYITLLFIIK